jgi:hypothetical protein
MLVLRSQITLNALDDLISAAAAAAEASFSVDDDDDVTTVRFVGVTIAPPPITAATQY